jgi:uroporphyrinogen-III synthase
LNSKTVVLTRSKEGNAELSSRLKGIGLSPVAVDTIAFSPPSDWSRVDAPLRRIGSYDWLLFTSATGVRFFVQRATRLGLRLPWAGKPAIAVVGPKTSSALAAAGLVAKFVPSSYRTSTLADELPSDAGRSVLLLHADIADGSLASRLEERGFTVDAAAIYSTTPPGIRTPPGITDASFIVFASPSAVRGLCAALPREDLRKLRRARALCVGPVTEAAAKEHGFENTLTPSIYTLDAVIEELAKLSGGGG